MLEWITIKGVSIPLRNVKALRMTPFKQNPIEYNLILEINSNNEKNEWLSICIRKSKEHCEKVKQSIIDCTEKEWRYEEQETI